MRARNFLPQVAEVTGDPGTRCISEPGRHMYFWKHEGRDHRGCIDLDGVQGAGEPWHEKYIEMYLTYVKNRISDEVRYRGLNLNW